MIRFRLKAADGSLLAEKTVKQFPITLGRSIASEVEVGDAGVSSRHAEIDWDGTHLHLRDVGSRNGTFVGEESVNEIVLNLPCSFRLGQNVTVEAELMSTEFEGASPKVFAPELPPAVFRFATPQAVLMRDMPPAREAVVVASEEVLGEERYWVWLRKLSPRTAALVALLFTFVLFLCHFLVFRENILESAAMAFVALLGSLASGAILAALFALPGALFREEYVYKPLFLQCVAAILIATLSVTLRPAFLVDYLGFGVRLLCLPLALAICLSGPYVFLFTTVPHRYARRLFVISGAISALFLCAQAYSIFSVSKRALLHSAFVGEFHASRGLSSAAQPVSSVTQDLRAFGARHPLNP